MDKKNVPVAYHLVVDATHLSAMLTACHYMAEQAARDLAMGLDKEEAEYAREMLVRFAAAKRTVEASMEGARARGFAHKADEVRVMSILLPDDCSSPEQVERCVAMVREALPKIAGQREELKARWAEAPEAGPGQVVAGGVQQHGLLGTTADDDAGKAQADAAEEFLRSLDSGATGDEDGPKWDEDGPKWDDGEGWKKN